MEITNKDFWAKFWSGVKLPQTVNYKFKNDRVIAEFIKGHVPVCGKDKSMIEIGCAPGKWLVFFNKEMGYKVDGLEFLGIAAEKTQQNMEINKISKESFNIYTADFLKWSAPHKYDAVVSLGFIEHFEDYAQIMKRHTDLLKDGGYLIIGVPRFKGINYVIQRLIEMFSEVKLLDNHNLRVMNVGPYVSYGRSAGLKISSISYLGGFEPGLFPVNGVKNKYIRFLIKAVTKVISVLFDKVNSQFTSSYLMAIYQKHDGAK